MNTIEDQTRCPCVVSCYLTVASMAAYQCRRGESSFPWDIFPTISGSLFAELGVI